jgi:hypothetical protein
MESNASYTYVPYIVYGFVSLSDSTLIINNAMNYNGEELKMQNKLLAYISLVYKLLVLRPCPSEY